MKLLLLIGALLLSTAPVQAIEASEDLNNEELGKMLEVYSIGYVSGAHNYSCIMKQQEKISQQEFEEALSGAKDTFSLNYEYIANGLLEAMWADVKRACAYKQINIGDLK
ncbi:hypothetical protein KR100_07980 [Synechococcus sp. KORDI-100]|uniref:hypothetical protein n=1 Tax=Synechococcus sp. KORDI-100 TaxID=1280380 RepID=UPI0004E03A59|nr:hypothetical protein [Synechococcus sp. KORDI-100]AII43300.1 hypothetical protein KR100_07980 [Synechococcus sp. KORDI-100]